MFVQKQLAIVQHTWFERRWPFTRVWKEAEAPEQAILLRTGRCQQDSRAWIQQYGLYSRDNDRVKRWLFIKCFLRH